MKPILLLLPALLLALLYLALPTSPSEEFAALIAPQPAAFGEYLAEREAMVDQQLLQIEDARLLAAMRRVPRHSFVPPAYRRYAYDNGPLPIGRGQTISQPFIVAYMTQALGIKPRMKVLEIGTGSGYQAAILAEMGAEVYTIEILGNLAEKAEQTLRELGYDEVNVRTGDGYAGWPEASPFDAIIVTAAPLEVPQALLDQLAIGGVLIAPIGEQYTVQTLTRFTKTRSDSIAEEPLLAVRFVPMVH